MVTEINGTEVKEDGDWRSCPKCDNIDFPILKWMSYCPCCGVELNIEEY